MSPGGLRLGIQQRVLPSYRVPFFDCLAESCSNGLSVFAGQPRSDESISTGKLEKAVFFPAKNHHFLGGRLYACSQSNLLEWLESWQPDVLVIEANPRYLSTPQAIKWMKARGRPVIGWGLGSPPGGGLLSGWVKYRRMMLINSLAAMITYSRQGAGEYERLGIPAQKIFIARNAAVHRPIGTSPSRPSVYKNGRACLIFVGRLQERKRLDLLLQACASLPDELQPELTIVGDGPHHSHLEELANRLYPRANFTGSRTGKPLNSLLDAADLFVLPGTGGLAIQQAMAHALPIIAAEADGTQTDLVRPENGWSILPGNLASLQNTLREALSNPVRLRQMGERSYEITRNEINLEEMSASFMKAVHSVWESPQ